MYVEFIKINANIKKSQLGFSLIEILVVVGIMSIVTMGVLTAFTSMNEMNIRAKAAYDITEINGIINDLLTAPETCTANLNDPAGDPLTFNKSNIDQPNTGEGISLSSLYFSKPDGSARTEVALSSTIADKKRIGALDVESIRFVMDTGTGVDYDTATEFDLGHIIVNYTIRGLPAGASAKSEAYPVWVKFSTNASGLSTVASCSTVKKNLPGMNSTIGGGIQAMADIFKEAEDEGYRLLGGIGLQTCCAAAPVVLYDPSTDYLYVTNEGFLKSSRGSTLCTLNTSGSCNISTTSNPVKALSYEEEGSGTTLPWTYSGGCPDRISAELSENGLEFGIIFEELGGGMAPPTACGNKYYSGSVLDNTPRVKRMYWYKPESP